jgi:hypothetical protein
LKIFPAVANDSVEVSCGILAGERVGTYIVKTPVYTNGDGLYSGDTAVREFELANLSNLQSPQTPIAKNDELKGRLHYYVCEQIRDYCPIEEYPVSQKS